MLILEHDGAQMQISECGAEMRAYCKDGKQYLWNGDATVWKGVAPVLFPAIGAMKNGGATIAGRWYAVPRHGFVRTMDFQVTEQGEDFVTLTVHDTEETQKVFPFAFALHVTHRLLPKGFETRFTIENHSSATMPFLIGGHPAFACPLNVGECFEDYILHFEKPERPETLTCALDTHTINGTELVDFGADKRTVQLRHSVFDRLDTYMFAGLNSRFVELLHKYTHKGIRLSCDMDVLAVWSMPNRNAPYVCLEPWQGCPAYENETGRFEDKPFHVALDAGQTYSCGYQMEILM